MSRRRCQQRHCDQNLDFLICSASIIPAIDGVPSTATAIHEIDMGGVRNRVIAISFVNEVVGSLPGGRDGLDLLRYSGEAGNSQIEGAQIAPKVFRRIRSGPKSQVAQRRRRLHRAGQVASSSNHRGNRAVSVGIGTDRSPFAGCRSPHLQRRLKLRFRLVAGRQDQCAAPRSANEHIAR